MAATTSGKSPRTIHVVQGKFEVSDRPDVVLTTILGSCVATCICDPKAKVGGINHFLLADGGSGGGGDLLRYGSHAMELLINALLRQGARRSRLEAKVFGGATMHGSLGVIGRSNGEFALKFLAAEGIPCVSQSLGGKLGRGIRYWPTDGRAQVRCLEDYDAIPVERPERAAPKEESEDITFF